MSESKAWWVASDPEHPANQPAVEEVPAEPVAVVAPIESPEDPMPIPDSQPYIPGAIAHALAMAESPDATEAEREQAKTMLRNYEQLRGASATTRLGGE